MQVYETLDLPVDRQVVGQYLQLPRVAADFANYLQLYENTSASTAWRRSGRRTGKVRASELAGAAFDESWACLACCSRGWRTARAKASGWTVSPTRCIRTSSISARAKKCSAPCWTKNRPRSRAAATQARPTRTRCLPPRARPSGSRLSSRRSRWKRCPKGAGVRAAQGAVREDVQARADAADRTDRQLANVFAFLDAAIPNSRGACAVRHRDDRELLYLWVYQNFGCEAYFAHNKQLLFDDTRQRFCGNRQRRTGLRRGTFCLSRKRRYVSFFFCSCRCFPFHYQLGSGSGQRRGPSGGTAVPHCRGENHQHHPTDELQLIANSPTGGYCGNTLTQVRPFNAALGGDARSRTDRRNRLKRFVIFRPQRRAIEKGQGPALSFLRLSESAPARRTSPAAGRGTSPAPAQLADPVQIERMRQDAGVFPIRLLDQRSGAIRDEGRAVKNVSEDDWFWLSGEGSRFPYQCGWPRPAA